MQQISLSNYHIKLLAAIFMVLDHVAVVFIPLESSSGQALLLYSILRGFGRLSFPLFAWLLGQGEAHTHNVGKYGMRLLLWGIISQPIFNLTFRLGAPTALADLNILFTLLIGLVCLRLNRAFPKFELPIWLLGAIAAQWFNVDYVAYGILLVALLSRFRLSLDWFVFWILTHLVLILVDSSIGIFQFPAVFTPLILALASHQTGAKARWFYAFYPGHLLLLWLIDRFLLPAL